MLKSKLYTNFLTQKSILLCIIFVLFAVVHIISLFKAQSPPENTFILLLFYGVTIWFYFQNLSQFTLPQQKLPWVIGAFIVAYFSIKNLSVFPGEFHL
jgi:hypothetical protein